MARALAQHDVIARAAVKGYRGLVVKMTGDGDVKALIRMAADDERCCSIVVMSGDGGMTDAVKYARRAGKCVFVVAWMGTLHPALANAANDHAFIDDLRPLISRVAL